MYVKECHCFFQNDMGQLGFESIDPTEEFSLVPTQVQFTLPVKEGIEYGMIIKVCNIISKRYFNIF
jgi:hypothetical protein